MSKLRFNVAAGWITNEPNSEIAQHEPLLSLVIDAGYKRKSFNFRSYIPLSFFKRLGVERYLALVLSDEFMHFMDKHKDELAGPFTQMVKELEKATESLPEEVKDNDKQLYS